MNGVTDDKGLLDFVFECDVATESCGAWSGQVSVRLGWESGVRVVFSDDGIE